MTDDKPIKTVTAPVLVVESKEPVEVKKQTAPALSDDEQEEQLKQKWLAEYLHRQEQIKAIPTASKQPYIMMVVVVTALVVISIVLIETFSPPTRDNSATITQIIGFAVPTLAGLFAYQKSQDTHVIVNSRLTEFIQKSEENALLKGISKGRKKAEDRADALEAAKQ